MKTNAKHTVLDESCSQEEVARIKHETKDLGTISVQVYEAKRKRSRQRNKRWTAEEEPAKYGGIPEKAATSLNISYGIR